MSDGWVRWSQWTAGGMVDFGQMPKRDISQQLRRFEKEAAKLLKKTGADHVLYGVKSYGDGGELEEVRFYLEPMTDERFEKDVASKTGFVVYAVHARRRKESEYMNKARRKAIEKVVSDLYDIQSAVEELRDEEQEYLDNIPENPQGSERYELAEQALENLNSA